MTSSSLVCVYVRTLFAHFFFPASFTQNSKQTNTFFPSSFALYQRFPRRSFPLQLFRFTRLLVEYWSSVKDSLCSCILHLSIRSTYSHRHDYVSIVITAGSSRLAKGTSYSHIRFSLCVYDPYLKYPAASHPLPTFRECRILYSSLLWCSILRTVQPSILCPSFVVISYILPFPVRDTDSV